MKKLGIVTALVVALVIALSCFAMVAFAADITPQTITISSASVIGIADQNFSAIAGAAVVVLGLSAASVVVLRRK